MTLPPLGRRSVIGRSENVDDATGSAVRHLALVDLLTGDQMMPVYRADIHSCAEFERRAHEMPLIVIWGENADNPDATTFTLSVNALVVSRALLRYMEEADARLPGAVGCLIADLSTLVRAGFVKTMAQSGLLPSEVCEWMRRPSLSTHF